MFCEKLINFAKFAAKSLFKQTFSSQASNFIKKETPTQVFFCEFYKIFKNTFFTEHLRATAFECSALLYLLTCFCSRPTALQHWLNEICHSEKIVLLNVSPLVRRVLTPEKTPILYCYIGKTDAQSSSLVLQPPSLHSQ